MATNALKLSHVDAFYGDSHVLGDVSFELGEARMLGLLGRGFRDRGREVDVAQHRGNDAARGGFGLDLAEELALVLETDRHGPARCDRQDGPVALRSIGERTLGLPREPRP